MCGIAGIWHRDGRPVEPRALESMVETLVHRGPDGAGAYISGGVGLGHRRLKVIDLSDAAAQPIWLPDRSLYMVYNGEIHNYLELATDLRAAGAALRACNDTEVVLWAYRIWGEQCFTRFNGMWAAAFWQPADARLVLSRDRFGIKPLVYSVRGARIAFASEPKALVAAFPEERRPDRQLVHDFVAGGVPDSDDHTFFENIRSVPPGQLLSIGLTHETTRRYWNFQPGQEIIRPDAPEAFLALLKDAVSVRLRSDVPVGVALSGGLDSSAVARLAAGANHQSLQCFSLRYPSASLDESAYALLVADDPARYQIHWVTPSAEDLVATTAAIVWHHDAPTPIRGRYPQWHVLREAGKHVTVVLGGQGADELLGGYDRFVLPYALDRLDPHLACVRSKWTLARELVELGRVSTGIHRLLPRLVLAAIARRLGVFPRKHALAFDGPIRNLPILHHRFVGASGGRTIERPYRSRLNNALWNELRSAGLPEILHSEDAISMAFSLESRLPFLDHRIVEFCFSLAYDEKIGEGWTKLLLRRATSGIVPEPIRLRRHKLGFPGDYAAWLAGAESFESVRNILLDQTTLERGWLDRTWLRHRLAGPRRQAQHWVRRHLQQVWMLLTLELWCRLYLDDDRGMRPAAPADLRDARQPITNVPAGGLA